MTIKDFSDHLLRYEKVSGWGQTNKTNIKIIEPENISQIQEIIAKSTRKSLITRGMGRSYGDAAQLKDSFALDLKQFKKIKINTLDNTVTAGAGITFKELLKTIIPNGYFLPVTPGTKNITVGGALSADIHGKNHHIDGSFGNHVKEISILDGKGEFHRLNPLNTKSPDEIEYFWSILGGMGLNGVIIEATFSLIPITTSLIKVDTNRFNSLDSLMEAMINADKKYRYSVAWIDSLHPTWRGILTCGDHLEFNELDERNKIDLLAYATQPLAKAPSFLPSGILNQFTVRAFNEAWFRKAPYERKNEFQKIDKYFYPLDAIDNWNNIYGPEGFIQYQFLVPDKSSFIIEKTLQSLKDISASSFLTVLKRFGNSNQAHLSFPKAGWTLAIDIPACIPNLFTVLQKLDQLIATNNGRIYLAKDSLMSPEIFKATYPDFDKWLKIKRMVDPKQIFYSDLAKRLLI